MLLMRSRDKSPRIERPLRDFFRDKILEHRHLERLVGDLVGEMRRDHRSRRRRRENDIAWKYRRVAAADRAIDLDRLMQREIGRRARPVMIGGKAELGDFGGNRGIRRR